MFQFLLLLLSPAGGKKTSTCRAPLELLAKYASDVDYCMLLDKDDLKMMVEQGSKEAAIAGRHITDDPTITPYR